MIKKNKIINNGILLIKKINEQVAASNDLSAKLNTPNKELEILLKKQITFNAKGFSA